MGNHRLVLGCYRLLLWFYFGECSCKKFNGTIFFGVTGCEKNKIRFLVL